MSIRNSNIPIGERVPRRDITQEEKDYVWNKGETIPDRDPNKYREDKSGNVICSSSHGKNTTMGWDVDHSKPLAKGGTYHLNNLQPLQAEQNRVSKNDTHPYNYGEEPQTGVSRYDLIDTEVDKRSSAVRSGGLLFNMDGTIDGRSSTVKDNSVSLTENGDVDKRCSAYRSGEVHCK